MDPSGLVSKVERSKNGYASSTAAMSSGVDDQLSASDVHSDQRDDPDRITCASSSQNEASGSSYLDPRSRATSPKSSAAINDDHVNRNTASSMMSSSAISKA